MSNILIPNQRPDGNSIYVERPQPLDAKTLFNTLEDALNIIAPNQRFKGQDFTIKNPPLSDSPNGEPKKYWFIEDYQEAGGEELWWDEAEEGGPPPIEEGWYTEDDWDGWWSRQEIPEIVPQPVLYLQPVSSGGPVDLSAHNADEEAHQPIQDKLAGDILPASKVAGYVNLDDSPMTVNDYANRMPGAWTGSKIKFQTEILDNLEKDNTKYDGVYFVVEK